MEAFFTYLWPHWPFFAWCALAAALGKYFAREVFPKSATAGWRVFGRRTLPLHPVLAGALLGCFWRSPEPSVTGLGAVVYFATAGALSLWFFEFVRRVLKKHGI